jgi:hypothetical protein
MARRFALDQNFPEPIVDALAAWLHADAKLVPIRTIDARMATIDDWEILHALHAADERWDGLITTDARMLNLPTATPAPELTTPQPRSRHDLRDSPRRHRHNRRGCRHCHARR